MTGESQKIFDYIFGLTVPGVKLELARVEAFAERIGTPHRHYPIIHIAGTNGKGSTAAMLAAILNAYGHKTGLFTSPHLIKPNERIRIGNQLVPDRFIIEKVETWKPDIEDLGITFFEVLTMLGMTYFHEQDVDLAIFETGLGGRLDATNIVEPKLSVITSISMDHENILGDSLAKIAMEKAGIIKAHKPLVLGKNEGSVVKLMQEVCEQRKAEMTYVPSVSSIQSITPVGLTQQVDLICSNKQVNVELPFLGLHQVDNFCNVLASLDTLGLELNEEIIQQGLNDMHWLGRMQPLSVDPVVLYDVAHNVEGLTALLDSLRHAGMQDAILIAAFNQRKNIDGMLQILQGWTGQVLYTEFKGYSALGRQAMRDQGVDPDLIHNDPLATLEFASRMKQTPEQAICFFGSHYLAESLFEHFRIDT
ncbi:MAG: bifunctional folylpolyglutamate synthase/dihydrofolate synthase [Candidatus Marinimicrobia bacterium]|nr:bifunctional folylpolyglutamate synthase/dihydrofolate synthase [Candidatus Neomarinimicrobiota bacterium]